MSDNEKLAAEAVGVEVVEKSPQTSEKAPSLRFVRDFELEYYDWNKGVSDALTAQLADCDEHGESLWNEKLVETAGFVPLEVRMKQMEQNGLMAQFQLGELSPEDLRQAYLMPDFEIDPDDELEEAIAKEQLREAFLQKLREERAKAESEAEVKNPHVLTPEEYAEFKRLVKAQAQQTGQQASDD